MSANSIFFRMHRILDIFFVGGFGTVQWVDPNEYAGTRPDAVVADKPHKTLQVSSALYFTYAQCVCWQDCACAGHNSIVAASTCTAGCICAFVHISGR